jgi:hypothetical protein
VNDKVWLYLPQPPSGTSSKLYKPWRGPYTIIEAKGALNYKLDIPAINGQAPHEWVHVSRLKPYYDPSSTSAARNTVPLEAPITVTQSQNKPKTRSIRQSISMIRSFKTTSGLRVVPADRSRRQIVGRESVPSMCVDIELGDDTTRMPVNALIVDNFDRTCISGRAYQLLQRAYPALTTFDRSDPCRTEVLASEVELPFTFMNVTGQGLTGESFQLGFDVHFDVFNTTVGPRDFDVTIGRDLFNRIGSHYGSCYVHFPTRTITIGQEEEAITIPCHPTQQAYSEISIDMDDQQSPSHSL